MVWNKIIAFILSNRTLLDSKAQNVAGSLHQMDNEVPADIVDLGNMSEHPHIVKRSTRARKRVQEEHTARCGDDNLRFRDHTGDEQADALVNRNASSTFAFGATS